MCRPTCRSESALPQRMQIICDLVCLGYLTNDENLDATQGKDLQFGVLKKLKHDQPTIQLRVRICDFVCFGCSNMTSFLFQMKVRLCVVGSLGNLLRFRSASARVSVLSGRTSPLARVSVLKRLFLKSEGVGVECPLVCRRISGICLCYALR